MYRGSPPDDLLLVNMVRNDKQSSGLSERQWRDLDGLLRRVDEDRWLSSRYAPRRARRDLTALYLFNHELGRVRTAVTDNTLGAIRFQYWREVVEEIESGGAVRRHDISLGTGEACRGGGFQIELLRRLLDGHQSAFEAKDRSLEPEAMLMAGAANRLAPQHNWGRFIREIAPAYAAARRGEGPQRVAVLPRAPSNIRPAIAHAVLRSRYGEGGEFRPLDKRVMIARAMFTGWI